MDRRIIALIPLVATMLSGVLLPQGISAKKKKVTMPKVELSGAAKDSADFMKNLKDAKVCKGMFNTYFDKKNKLWIELPDSVLDCTCEPCQQSFDNQRLRGRTDGLQSYAHQIHAR